MNFQDYLISIISNLGLYRVLKLFLTLFYKDGITFTYADGDNPNGACLDIAGICDPSGRIVGMMPHPERRAEAALGGEDGKRMFSGIVGALS